MNWTEVKIVTTALELDSLCASLLELGVGGLNICDPDDFRELVDNKYGDWDYIDEELLPVFDGEPYVSFYLPDNVQGRETLGLVSGLFDVTVSSVNEEDWANNWKQYFKPFEVGERLLVKPSWEDCQSGERIILEIDPASSFGTGQHETTKLCLLLLEKHLQSGDNLLDLGCGSGILSIAGLLLGAKTSTAIDILENSVDTAKENAAKNNIPPEKYILHCGNILSDENLLKKLNSDYDIITANIVADVIIKMAALFKNLIRKGGKIILSGIIEERAYEVEAAMKSENYSIKEKLTENGWVAFLVGR